MKERLWKLLALVVSWHPIARWIIQRSRRTPYRHLDGYMHRWWLFNAYEDGGGYVKQGWLRKRLPSIRVHKILREDRDQHMHDHPWDARTIILDGQYIERCQEDGLFKNMLRSPGCTRAIRFGEFHRIRWVQAEGVYTLFFTWKYMGTWGFNVDGVKVPYREYLK